MKVKIEAKPGELDEKVGDVVTVLEKLTGRVLSDCDCLEKAFNPNKQIKQTSADIEYPIIADSIKRSQKQVDRIRKLMDQKIAAILG